MGGLFEARSLRQPGQHSETLCLNFFFFLNTSLRKSEGTELYFALGMGIVDKLLFGYLCSSLSAVEER